MGKEVSFEERESDISILKLVNYALLFFIPLLLSLVISILLSKPVGNYLQVSAKVAVEIMMIGFTLIVFFFIIPFLRKRESIHGIRFALIAFLLVGVGFTLPSLIAGDYSLLLDFLIYFGSYVLLTFIFAPEVLGMSGNVADWFNHYKQLLILLVYVSIVLFYVVGFGVIYHDIANDPTHPTPFQYSYEMDKSYSTFVYYSIITFATVGYGEIIPVSPAARLVVSFEVVLGMVINVVFIAILFVFISNAHQFYGKKEVEKIAEEEKVIEEKEEKIAEEEKKIKKGEEIIGEIVEKKGKRDEIDELIKKLKKL
ncbi:potassium channel family protein [candidate division KSB1 bacterium]